MNLSARPMNVSGMIGMSSVSRFFRLVIDCLWRKSCQVSKNLKGVRCSANGPPPAWPGRAVSEDVKKRISLIGSTGSIGTQTLDIVAENPERFKVVALAAGSNITLLAEQIRAFKPSLVSIRNSEQVAELRDAIADVHPQPEIVVGVTGIVEVAQHPEAVQVVTGIVGCAGLKAPDRAKYPSMDLSYAAGRAGGTMTGVLSAANEKAVELFLEERIGYLDIIHVIERTCDKHRQELVLRPSLEDIVYYDQWARQYAAQVAQHLERRSSSTHVPV